jgi:hypothetical protein
LPGASAVGRALETSDIATERAAQMDTIEQPRVPPNGRQWSRSRSARRSWTAP